MKRFGSLASAAALLAAPLALVVVTGGPARAACPSGSGTVPGTGAERYVVGLDQARAPGEPTPTTDNDQIDNNERAETIYVDDRDYAGLDDDGGNGLWLYLEWNGESDLQRGGENQAFGYDLNRNPTTDPQQDPGGFVIEVLTDGDGTVSTNPNVPRLIEPGGFEVIPPSPGGLPVFPDGLILLEDGLGGGTLADTVDQNGFLQFGDDCKDADLNDDRIIF